MGRPAAARRLSAGGRLRVHGGDARGRRLAAPAGVRPSQGLVKEAVFNSLGAEVRGAVVLDLFAGSGALGIEALSRGAARATFVERDERAAAVIRRNLEALGMEEVGRVVRSEAGRWLAGHPEEVAAATLVLLDPPYNDPVLDRVLALLDAAVKAGGAVVVEHARRRPPAATPRLRGERERAYGDTAVTVLRAL